MNENTITIIRELSDKLGITAEHLCGALIKQALIHGSFNMLGSIFLIFAIVVPLKFLKRGIAKQNTDLDSDNRALLCLVWIAVTIIMLTLLVECSYDAITAFTNPEYWALKQLL